MGEIERTQRTNVRRLPGRGSYDRDLIHQVLDEGLVCHVGFADAHGPVVIPMAYARDGDTLLLHGSRASRTLRHLASDEPVCVTTTILDGLVLARSAFHHSMNYRAVVVFGRATEITDEAEKRAALEAYVEALLPGRWRAARQPTAKELAATAVVRLAIDEASAKVRAGPPVDDEDDLERPVWAGVLPLETVVGTPEPAADLAPGLELPDALATWRPASRE